jgi:hypothetical protein
MSCPEKEMLQLNCSDAWKKFESAFEQLGVPLDPKIGDVVQRLMKSLSSTKGLIDPQTRALRTSFLDAIALLRDHQKASSLLSRHLHTHRC